MKMIVGLGNPGEKYAKCRHNTGFTLIDELARKKVLSWDNSEKFKAMVAKISGGGEEEQLILVKPQNFMNNSGPVVAQLASFYKIPLGQLYIIHDDVDLPFGKVKTQIGSGAAGHHGVESIIETLGSKDFWRIRVGIGKPSGNTPVEEFVLRDFSEEELEKIKNIEWKVN